MTSGTVSVLLLLLSSNVIAQAPVANSNFNQVLNLNGDMNLNSFTFPDRSKVEAFSQAQQQLIVNQNTPPISGQQVTGSTGQPFVALMPQSLSVNTNGATNLVGGQVELVMDPQMLQQNAVNPDNTFVGKLSPDRQSWMVMETVRSVNITDMTVRMVKMNAIDGEYMALGRQTVETNAALTPFGSDQTSSVVIQGTGLQEAEFVDGFRMSVRATQPITMTVNVKNGVNPSMLTALQGQTPVNNYRYLVTTNLAGVTPDLNRQATVVQLPINAQRIQMMMQTMGVQANGQVALAVAQRGVQQNPGGATGQLQGVGAGAPAPAAAAPAVAAQRRGRSDFRENIARQVQGGTPTTNNNPAATQLLLNPTFTPIQANAVIDPLNMRIAIPVGQIDGEFIITMQNAGAAGSPQPAAAQGQGQGQQQGAAASANGTATAAEAPAAAKPAERRQEAGGDAQPPTGAILITMKEINKMVELLQWGGQAPIGQMMTDYVKANNGTS
ncbi:hypothetical protein K491DRAFT_647531 [Lophiostoma macrostomum CBS 122681]|uniref:Uncharacterized protein n=1 Tax=Lophiostoma macrostomum CBS 122681 TaxID=1314788 RepID=A0A6A6TPD6_9PLEO|nr:hypothetical protein K491DRAFT_647531 [Lophiostoma macrostomum CBS 122681]